MTTVPPDEEHALEAALLERWQTEGDAEALDALMRIEIARLKVRVQRDGRSLLSASISASDVAQEAAVRMLGREGEVAFDAPVALRAYLWQTAWRLLLNRLRRRGRRVVMHDVERIAAERPKSGTTLPDGEALHTRLLVAVNLLDDAEREIIEQAHFEGRSTQEIGERLGISQDAARMRLVRARRNLAKRLGDWDDVMEIA